MNECVSRFASFTDEIEHDFPGDERTTSYVPVSQIDFAIVPSPLSTGAGSTKSMWSRSWSPTRTASRFCFGSVGMPFGSAHDQSTPPPSSRRSKWCVVA